MFASLDEIAGVISFHNEDGSLAGKTFAIFINANVNVTLEI